MSRYIPHDSIPPTDFSEVRTGLVKAIHAGVARVRRHPSSKPSVYVGAGGHHLMHAHLAASGLAAELPLRAAPLVDIAAFPLQPAASGARASFLETDVGTAALVVGEHLRAPSDRTTQRARTAADIIAGAIRTATSAPLDDDGCEVLYGRAGLLYTLLFLRSYPQRIDSGDDFLTQVTSDETVKLLMDDIVARGVSGAHAYADELSAEPRQRVPALMWRWHGKRYLGGAHGVAGILQMLLRCPRALLAAHWDALLDTLEWLLTLQQPSGNWPHKAPRGPPASVTDDELVQSASPSPALIVHARTDARVRRWCHGAPAVLILLSTLLQAFREGTAPLYVPAPIADACRSALARGGALVYARGLLRKGVGLCHGVAGSVYALLAVAEALDSLGNTEWLGRAVHLAHLACTYQQLEARGDMHTPDRPYSLYEGVAGMVCAWADTVRRIDALHRGSAEQKGCTGMPGYDDLVD